jgi:hypothetical protein
MDVFVEAISRAAEGRLKADDLGYLLTPKRGHLVHDDLPD